MGVIILIILCLFPFILIMGLYNRELSKSDKLNIFLLGAIGILAISLSAIGKIWLC